MFEKIWVELKLIKREIIMRSTIKDIAKESGFSTTTVSLVLNNKAVSIPDETKGIILKIAEKLNYHTNQVAVGLVKKQTKTIGLIISDVSNQFFGKIAKGVEAECNEQGWNLILCNTNDYHKRELEYIQALDDKGVDGIILCLAKEDNRKKVFETVNCLSNLEIPHVMVDRYVSNIEGYFVSVDHWKGGYLAGEYLSKSGHNKIGCITGPKHLEDSRNRTNGFLQALKDNGISCKDISFFIGDYDINSGAEGAEYLYNNGVSAIFAYNELMAYGVYRWANQIGVKIPRDISLVGYDDVGYADILFPPLTSIKQPVYEMGRESVKQIISIIKEKCTERQKVQFEPQIIIRDSVRNFIDKIGDGE